MFDNNLKNIDDELRKTLEKFSEKLHKSAFSLIDEKDFYNDGTISIPSSVDIVGHEDNLKHAIMAASESFNPLAEVKYMGEKDRIDVMLELSDNLRIGVECKTKGEKIDNEQLERYISKLPITYIYRAIFAINDFELPLLEKIFGDPYRTELNREKFRQRSALTKGRRGLDPKTGMPWAASAQMGEVKTQDNREIVLRVERYLRTYHNSFGLILYSPLGEFYVKNPTVIKQGDIKIILNEQSILRGEEAMIKYSMWKHLKENGYIVATESPLTNAGEQIIRNIRKKPRLNADRSITIPSLETKSIKTGHFRTDITAMPKKQLHNTEDDIFDIIAIECKAKGHSVSKGKIANKLREQLNSYTKSGEVSEVYVALPEQEASKLDGILNQRTLDEKEDYSHIGIFSIASNGTVEKIREARSLPLRERLSVYDYKLVDNNRSIFQKRIYIPQDKYSISN